MVVGRRWEYGDANKLAEIIKERIPTRRYKGLHIRAYSKRRLSTCRDRLIASHMGYYAVESLLPGRRNIMVAY